ncbi:MAG: T9SS type A sorting domain-containing protein [Bacteroidetes bacterium]|nr:T9SS type A sorting domain-containing protein [Bacteroidota bacterium]
MLNFIAFKRYYLSRLDSNSVLSLPLDSATISELTSFRDNGLHYVSNQAGNLLCFFAGICQELPEVQVVNAASSQSTQSNPSNIGLISSKEMSNWEVFPNPSTDKIVLKSSSSNQLIKQIEILDEMGRILHTQRGNGAKSLELSLSILKVGSYYLKILAEDGDSEIQLIYKQ